MLLLDTCSLVWLATDPQSLSQKAQVAINDDRQVLFCSAISAWEIALAHNKRRLLLKAEPKKWFASAVRKYHVRVIGVSWRFAVDSALLPKHHNDPADRIILATALARNLPIVSPDRVMPKYSGVQMIW